METMLELSERKKLVVVKLAPSWIQRSVHTGILYKINLQTLNPMADGTSSPWMMVATVV